VKKWEMELQTLRESNARLTTALQESAASVEQWKRQFSICRDENDRLRSKVGLGSQRDRGPGRLEQAEEMGRRKLLSPLCLHPTGRRETFLSPPSMPHHPAFLGRTSIMEIIDFYFLLLRKR
jgi:hypothetical protein